MEVPSRRAKGNVMDRYLRVGQDGLGKLRELLTTQKMPSWSGKFLEIIQKM